MILGTIGLLLALVFLIRKKPQKIAEEVAAQLSDTEKSGWWSALTKTRARFLGMGSKSKEELLSTLEEACIVSDLGVQNTQELLATLPWTNIAASENTQERLEISQNWLSQTIYGWLRNSQTNATATWPVLQSNEPTVIWFVGVNGVGKTTSIAKLAQELKDRGHSVILAAGDTFRAAASEQLGIWAERLQIECVRGPEGGDSSAVLFDAIEAAKARKIEFVLCDSAGRLHNQNQLMEALTKNKRVMAKALPSAPHETLLVLDAHTGQNMLNQAEQFTSSVQVTGLILTKVDGTSRGGAVVAVAKKLGLPIRRLGLGETAKDFVSFDAKAFSESLFGGNVEKAPVSVKNPLSSDQVST